MQLVSSRIWTRVAVFISYDDNNYTTGTSTIERKERELLYAAYTYTYTLNAVHYCSNAQ